VSWLKRLVAGLSLRRAGLGFVVDKVALGQVFLRVLRFTLSISFHHCSTLIYHLPMTYAIALTKQHVIILSVLSYGLHLWPDTWLEESKEVLLFLFVKCWWRLYNPCLSNHLDSKQAVVSASHYITRECSVKLLAYTPSKFKKLGSITIPSRSPKFERWLLWMTVMNSRLKHAGLTVLRVLILEFVDNF
jgi:hypothetical protein